MDENNKPTPKSTVEIPDWLKFRLEALARDYNLDIETIIASAVLKELAVISGALKQNNLDGF
jgi:predicted transcriptional regulator